ncbi:MAG: hypothetical protein OXE85_10580, partial [Roseovarius sp.]|nr:hypothetical protein [Roseovarius sp.]
SWRNRKTPRRVRPRNASRLHDDPPRAALPRDAGNPPEAVPFAGGGEIAAARADVRSVPGDVDAGARKGHGLPLPSSRRFGSSTRASIRAPRWLSRAVELHLDEPVVLMRLQSAFGDYCHQLAL